MSIVPTIAPLVHAFAPCFTAPSFANFSFLLLSWIATSRRRTICGLIRAAVPMPANTPAATAAHKHVSVFHRFFSRAKWQPDTLGLTIAMLVGPCLATHQALLIVDDTLVRRSGPWVLGAGMHLDPLLSTQTRKYFHFGLNFVVLAVWLPLPSWLPSSTGGLALPLLFRLYRTKPSCPEGGYRKRTQLAAEMLHVVRTWWPERRLDLVGDTEYAASTVLGPADDLGLTLFGPIHPRADLRLPDPKPYLGRGRPPVWGFKTLSPSQLAAHRATPWRRQRLSIYGRVVTLLVKSCVVTWKRRDPHRPLKVVVTRDPNGRFQDAYFYCSDPKRSVRAILQTISRRWALEVCFRDLKQLLGLNDVANGYDRRATRPETKTAGPQAPTDREPLTSARTAPFAIFAYATVVVWYVRHGRPLVDLNHSHRVAPWYRHKATICFADMLDAFRRRLTRETFLHTHADLACATMQAANDPSSNDLARDAA